MNPLVCYQISLFFLQINNIPCKYYGSCIKFYKFHLKLTFRFFFSNINIEISYYKKKLWKEVCQIYVFFNKLQQIEKLNSDIYWFKEFEYAFNNALTFKKQFILSIQLKKSNDRNSNLKIFPYFEFSVWIYILTKQNYCTFTITISNELII